MPDLEGLARAERGRLLSALIRDFGDVVALNHAVAASMAAGPEAALPLVDALGASLADYHLWHATRADLLRRLGRPEEALGGYERAHALAQNDVERRFLATRLAELRSA